MLLSLTLPRLFIWYINEYAVFTAHPEGLVLSSSGKGKFQHLDIFTDEAQDLSFGILVTYQGQSTTPDHPLN